MSLYTMRGADGREYGPVSEDQLNQWIREGRANAQTEVRSGEGAFQTLGSLPEFAGALGGSGSAAPMPSAAPVTPRVGNYLPSRGSTSAATIRDAAVPLAGASFWMKLIGGTYVFLGAITCIGIITAIIGVPMILMGLGAWRAGNNARMAATNGDAFSLTQANANLKTFFLIFGIFTLLMLLFYLAYFAVIAILIATGGFELPENFQQ